MCVFSRYSHGCTRRIDDFVQALGVTAIGKDKVPCICKQLDGVVPFYSIMPRQGISQLENSEEIHENSLRTESNNPYVAQGNRNSEVDPRHGFASRRASECIAIRDRSPSPA
jgi:hypothetical protein